jgi:hypothetical protein
MENKYQRGKIYKLVSSQTDKIYIGSTISTLKLRKSQHKNSKKNNKNNSSKFICCYEDFDIILIKEYPCNCKKELLTEEGNIIKQYLDICVNYQIAGRTTKEYYIDNKQKIKEQNKKYSKENIESIKIYKKNYHIKNKDRIVNKTRLYRLKNIDYINEKKRTKKYYCECCKNYTCYDSKARHLKTKKHQSNSALYNLM